MTKDYVSVIIPTVGKRDELLSRAISSVLRQTYKKIEIIVVIDGQSKRTNNIIHTIDNRIKIVETIKNVGGSTARNLGVKIASGEFVAFLDDDDKWSEEKIEKQIHKYKKCTSKKKYIICFTSVRVNGKQDEILPRMNWKNSNNISDYLFAKTRFRRRGFIQTSSIMTLKKTLLDIPFTDGLIKHQDWDWLLQIQRTNDYEIIQVEEPLVYYDNHISSNKRVGYINRWKFSNDWIEKYKSLITNRAYVYFLIDTVICGIWDDKKISTQQKLFHTIIIYKKIINKHKKNGIYIFYIILKFIQRIFLRIL